MLSHAFGAAFDNPDLIVAAVVGDGEAESGPLAGAWRGTTFLNPARDGAVLPILHLNGYKISGPTVLGRDSDDDIRAFLQGNGYEAHFVEGDDPAARAPGVRRDARPVLRPHSRHPARGPASTASSSGRAGRPSSCARRRAGPGPKEVDGHPVEGTFRVAPGAAGRHAQRPGAAGAARGLDALATSRRRCSTPTASSIAELAALAPQGDRRMSANPHANGGKLLVDLDIPDFRDYAVEVDAAGRRAARVHPPARQDAARRLRPQRRAGELPPVLPRRDELQPPRQRLRGREPLLRRPHARHRRPRVAGRPGHGGAQRAPLRGLAGGLHADRPARPVRDLRGVRDGLGVDDGAAHQVAPGSDRTCPGGRRSRRSTSCSPRPAGATTTTASATRAPA